MPMPAPLRSFIRPKQPSGPAIRLPTVLPIGFTGHRNLSDESQSRNLIYELLRDRKQSSPALLYGVSSAASGGDLLFAESCIELGIPLRILLPAPKNQFREDFDESSWLRAEQVFRQALSVEVIDGGECREERYYHCSLETVRLSRLMVALWDGEPSRGPGGTAETVSFAESLGMPVIWIHSVTGAVRNLNEPAAEKLLHDPELEFLNQLPDPVPALPADSPGDLARAWFLKLDEGAARLAPRVRRLASVPVVYTAVASVLSGAASRGAFAGVWLAISAVMGITANVLPKTLRVSQRRSVWARARIAAEVCRSALALWDTPGTYEVIKPEILPEVSAMLDALNLLKMKDASRTAVSVEDFKRRYRKDRMEHQLRYFEKNMRQAERHARRYRGAIRICSGAAVVITVWMSAARLKFVSQYPLAVAGRTWLALAASVLFQIATISGALLIVNESERRRRRFQQMHESLSALAALFDGVRTWSSVLGVVDRIEKTLLVELIEWKALIQNVRLPRS